MKWYNVLLHGWSLETDSATGMYSYGTIPYYCAESYDIVRFYLKVKLPRSTKRFKNRVKNFASSFKTNFPWTSTVLTLAAAGVGYFVSVGLLMKVSMRILSMLKVF